jgi:hypothetical protein
MADEPVEPAAPPPTDRPIVNRPGHIGHPEIPGAPGLPGEEEGIPWQNTGEVDEKGQPITSTWPPKTVAPEDETPPQ